MKRILSQLIRAPRATPEAAAPAPGGFVWRVEAREESWALHVAESGDLAIWLKADDTVSSGIARAGGYERAVTGIIHGLLRPGGLFLDVGANVGWHALAAGLTYRKLGAGRAIAFEAQPSIAAYLSRSVARSGLEAQVEVHALALGDEEGPVFLRPPGRNSGGVHVVPTDSAGGGGETGAMRRLDDIDLGAAGIDCIKLDIEGGEPAFLDGAVATLARMRPPIVSEVHPRKLTGVGRTSAAAYVGRLRSLGYDAMLIDARGVCTPLDVAALGERPVNALFMPVETG